MFKHTNLIIAKFLPRANGKNAEPSHFQKTGVRTLSSDPRPGFPEKFPLFYLGSSGIEISVLQSVLVCPWSTKEHTSSGSTDVLGSGARAVVWDLPCGLQWCLALTQPVKIMLFSPCHGTPWRQLKLSWASKKKASVLSFLGQVLQGGWLCFKEHCKKRFWTQILSLSHKF